MDSDYNFEVGDEVDGWHSESNRRIRGKVLEVLPDRRYLVISNEKTKDGVPVGEKVIVSGDDLND